MHFYAGGVEKLVEWFNSPDANERMLCLFVPKNPDDQALLGQLFDARGLISPQLGSKLALCLFSSEATLRNMVGHEPPKSDIRECLLIPGLVETRNMRQWQPIDPVGAANIDPEVRDEVMLRSASITNEIVDYFDLDWDRDLPCLIFVARGSDTTPFIVPTHGAANLKNVRALFDDLGRIVEVVDGSDMLDQSAKIAKRNYSEARRSDLRTNLEQCDKALGVALDAAASAAQAYGLGPTITGIQPSQARHLFRILGLGGAKERSKVLPETRLAAEAALQNSDVHVAFRKVVRAGKARQKIVLQVEEVDREINRQDQGLISEPVKARLQTVEDLISDVCRKYDGKFRRSEIYMSMRRWLQVLTGAAKVAEDLVTKPIKAVDEAVKAIDSK